MKVRNGFVSNSSSSSFVIKKKYLTDEQIGQIKNYHKEALRLVEEGKARDSIRWDDPRNQDDSFMELPDFGYLDNDWWINETDTNIEGSCVIDNFSMMSFLHAIGVDTSKVDYED